MNRLARIRAMQAIHRATNLVSAWLYMEKLVGRDSNLDQLSVHVLAQNLEDVVAALVLGNGMEVVPLAAGVLVEPVAGVDVLIHVAPHQVA